MAKQPNYFLTATTKLANNSARSLVRTAYAGGGTGESRRERLSNTDGGKSPKYRNYLVIKYGCRSGATNGAGAGIKKMQNGLPPGAARRAFIFIYPNS